MPMNAIRADGAARSGAAGARTSIRSIVTLMIGAASACGVARAASARDDIGAPVASRVPVVDRNGRARSPLMNGETIAGDSSPGSIAV
jgi:hypothetical protein